MKEKPVNNTGNKKIWTMVLILAILLFFSTLIALFIGPGEAVVDYNTAIIPINGPIVVDSSGGFFSSDSASSTEIIKMIEKAKSDGSVKAVIFEINSPGGSPVATDEIAYAIESLKEDNITTVAWIRETGASGAYWIASSTDYIVANRMSIVGSIGVFGSYLEWYGLMDNYNVTYKRLVSGEYKDTGTPFRPMSDKEELYIQTKLDKLHDYFISEVAENRNMSYGEVKILATGEIFLGVEAKENGLIDETGSEKEALEYVKSQINEEPKTKEFEKEKSFLESLMDTMSKNSYYIGQGIGDSFVQEKNTGFKITT
ncbi:MAG: signal peptide peptidase SppA [Candidatus Woesearchaeota archaeon]